MNSWSVPLVAAVALAAGGCASPKRLAFEQAASELPQAQAEAKRLGLPLTGADLRPNPPVPPDQNAAEPIRRAIADLEAAEKTERNWQGALSEAVRQPSPETFREARRTLQALGPALRSAEEAAAKPSVDFGRKWDAEPAFSMLFPELGAMKRLASALAMRGAFRAAAGEPPQAVARDFEAAFRLARHAGADPVLIAGLVQVACDAAVVRSMELAATARSRDRALLEALRGVAARAAEERPDLSHHLRGEVYLGVSGARNLGRLAQEYQLANESADEYALRQVRELLPDGIPPDVAQKAYEARVLQAWSDAYRDPQALRNPLRAKRVLEQMEKRHTDEKDPTMALNRIVFPVFSEAGDAYARGDAYLSAFQSLMRVLEFRAAQGRWPKSLAEAGAEGTDPFDGQPLRYKAEGDSARVYSVGSNRRDDGGAEGGANDRRDVVALFPRRPEATRGAGSSGPALQPAPPKMER